jgi:hypothetical protein
MTNMLIARTKHTARLGTGGVSARQTQAWRAMTAAQASSYDPPIIDTEQSDAVQTLLAQFAEEDLMRDAEYRYEDLIEPTLTGRISRTRRETLIRECRAQILAERAAADALLSFVPPQANVQPDVQAEPQAQPAPDAPITGNKRNRGHLKSKGTILHNAARGPHAPEYWTVNYKRCRNTFYSQAEAEAALKNYKDFDICPCCDQAPQPEPAQPPPVPSIRCVALDTGVIQVTINGVTITVNGDFTYP